MNKPHANEPSGIRLIRLMDSQLPQIVRKERKNETRICLYSTGTYWVAFEQSAYRLCQLFPTSNISIASHPQDLFPVVMADISDDELRAYAKRHIFCCDNPDYKELTCSQAPTQPYHIWHRNAVQELASELKNCF